METADDLFCRRLARAADRDGYDAWIDAIVDGDDVLDLVTRLSTDRKSVVQGKSVDLGGRRIIKKKIYYSFCSSSHVISTTYVSN